MSYSGAVTYALGHLLCTYLERKRQGEEMCQEAFEQEFDANMKHGKELVKEMLQGRRIRK